MPWDRWFDICLYSEDHELTVLGVDVTEAQGTMETRAQQRTLPADRPGSRQDVLYLRPCLLPV